MLTTEVSGEIHRLFTEEPEGGLPYAIYELRRNIDPIEEQRLLREWATNHLAAAAIEESEVVVRLLEGIHDEKPFNAFGLGINIVRQLRLIHQDTPAEKITSRLQSMLDEDAERTPDEQFFTDFDRRWLEGHDLDFLDEDSLALCMIWEVFGGRSVVPEKATLFGLGHRKSGEKRRVAIEASGPQGSEIQRIRTLSSHPRNTTNDVSYDKELLRLVLDFEELYGYGEVMRLVGTYPARSEEFTHKVNLVIDRSMHTYARKKLKIAHGGSVDAALDFIYSVRPRTELGAKLIEAFRVRITKNRST